MRAHGDTLRLPARKLRRICVPLFGKANALQHLHDPRPVFADEAKIPFDREIGDKAGLLEDI